MTVVNGPGAQSMIQELGRLVGPVMIFGGAYSNLQATLALQSEADRLGIPSQQVICNGDLLAYCGDPQATLDLVRHWGVSVVQGNCEQSLADGAPDCGCGFDQGSTCKLLSVDWYRFARQQVREADRRWMAQLPGQIRFELAGRSFSVTHGGLSRNNRFIFASSPESDFDRELALTDAEVVIGGHCGLPFGRRIGNRYWLNSGVIGMPANDATQDGWYLLLEVVAGVIACRWCRLPYDATAAAARMSAVGLPRDYARALQSGLWPSMDVLPEQERAQCGQPLACSSLSIR